MLYLLSPSNEGLGTLEPLPFLDASDLQRTEKDLENLLATHLLEVRANVIPIVVTIWSCGFEGFRPWLERVEVNNGKFPWCIHSSNYGDHRLVCE